MIWYKISRIFYAYKMLSSVRIQNFKSIDDLTVDFSFAEKSAPKGHKESEILYFLEPTSARKDRVVPVMNFYGANASGKSNIVQSLYIFQKILIEGFSSKRYIPNKLIEKNEASFLFVFFVNKQKYKYLLEYNRTGILKEELFVNDTLIFSIKDKKVNFKNIATNAFDKNKLQEKYEQACLTRIKNSEELIQIKTFLGFIENDISNLNKYLSEAIKFLFYQLVILDSNKPCSEAVGLEILAGGSDKESIEIALKKISIVMKQLDLDIHRFSFEDKEVEDHKFFNEYSVRTFVGRDQTKKTILSRQISSYHKDNKGNDIQFSIEEESIGTQTSFALVGIFLKILESGGVLIVDELDNSLHTLLLKSLMRMFKDKNINTTDAQLISTLHNTDILENKDYKMSEFSFVMKNPKRGSFIKKLFSRINKMKTLPGSTNS